MRPSEIAAVAAQRGYDCDPVTHRLSHASFLKQQDEAEGMDGATESGDIPDDYAGKPLSNATRRLDASITGQMPSIHGGTGGLPPAAPLVGGGGEQSNEALGEQASAEDHTGETNAHATLGAIAVTTAEEDKAEPKKDLINTPASVEAGKTAPVVPSEGQ